MYEYVSFIYAEGVLSTAETISMPRVRSIKTGTVTSCIFFIPGRLKKTSATLILDKFYKLLNPCHLGFEV